MKPVKLCATHIGGMRTSSTAHRTTIILVSTLSTDEQDLGNLVRSQPQLHVVGRTNTEAEAVQLAEDFKPDILIASWLPPRDLSGLIQKVRARSPQTRVIVVADAADKSLLYRALQAGAKSFLIRETISMELIPAIEHVRSGRFYLSPPLREHAVEAFLRTPPEHSANLYGLLSKRERQIFRLVAQGQSAPEIANRLKISPRTVEAHRANVMRKLGVRSRAELIRRAYQSGMLQ